MVSCRFYRDKSAIIFATLVISVLFAACGGSQTNGCPKPSELPFDTTIGQGDVLSIDVDGEEDMTGEYTISVHGTVRFPFVGEVDVAGLEPDSAASMIVKKLQEGKYFKAPHPQLTIAVKEYRGKSIIITGAIAKPGTIPMKPGLGAADAIALAGGGTPLANENATVVTREVGEKLCRYQVPALDVRRGTKRDFPLRPGDRIDVPKRPF